MQLIILYLILLIIDIYGFKKKKLVLSSIITGIMIIGIIILGYLWINLPEEKFIQLEDENINDEFNHVEDVSKILNSPGLNFDLRNQRDKIIEDEEKYGNNYMKFINFQLYSRKPDRIIFKQGNKDGFYIFEQTDKAYEHLLVVSEDRMAYSVMQDYNLWCFTPDSIDTILKSGDNYIIYDFDNGDLTEYDEGFQKDVIFRFNSENRLYRLVSYLAEFKEKVSKENLGKSEFAANTEISGYNYMMKYGKEWYDD